MDYKIIDINNEQGWVKIVVTWDDATTYEKRMMVDVTNLDTIKKGIETWLVEYLKNKKEVVYDEKIVAEIGKVQELSTETTAAIAAIPKPIKP